MVKVTLPIAVLASLASAQAVQVNFINKCTDDVELYHSQSGSAAKCVGTINPGGTHTEQVEGPAHVYRDGKDPQATLAELSMQGGATWYDISIIPPMPGWCSSWLDCKAITGKVGFNRPMAITPSKPDGKRCKRLNCAANDPQACADAYLFPKDDTKTHTCPGTTGFDITFCPGGDSSPYSAGNVNDGQSDDNRSASASTPPPTQAPTEAPSQAPTEAPTGASVTISVPSAAGSSGKPAPPASSNSQGGGGSGTKFSGQLEFKNVFKYEGKYAGNMPGSYNQVTALQGCATQPKQVKSNIGPMSEEVTMVYRGPMDFTDFAVYTNEGNGWQKVSSFCKDSGETNNIVFMNNKNIDYSQTTTRGPQGFATSDGKNKADKPQLFGGELAEASDPNNKYGGPDVSSGVEINVLQDRPCTQDDKCDGYFGDNDFHGWGGERKIFVSKVQMPDSGSSPNQPAMWMLNAQVVHSNQYGCNCRGMGPTGGCGELDVAEVIETNEDRSSVSTHYYFYDGNKDSLAPGGDNFAPRPKDEPTVYIVAMDSEQNGGMIRVAEVAADSWDFSKKEISQNVYEQIVNAKTVN